jgi:hypothetical protein
MKKTILILMLSLGFAFATDPRTKVIINNTSSCFPTLNLWGTASPFNSTFTVFSTGTSTLPTGTSTFNCLVDITHVEFDWGGGVTVSGFNVAVGNTGSGNFTGGGCFLGLPYSWTCVTTGATCSGVTANVLTINIQTLEQLTSI